MTALILLRLLCDWSKKLMVYFQPIKKNLKTNHDLVIRVFPRLKQFAFFFTLTSNWPMMMYALILIGRQDDFGFGFSTLN